MQEQDDQIIDFYADNETELLREYFGETVPENPLDDKDYHIFVKEAFKEACDGANAKLHYE